MNAREVRRIRESLGMSPEAFSEFLLVSRPTVTRWEQGKRAITPPMAAYIRMKAATVPQAAPSDAVAV